MKRWSRMGGGVGLWLVSAALAMATPGDPLDWTRPLAAQQAELEIAANAGDSHAAWALYRGLERCRHAAVRAATPERATRNPVQGARLRQCLDQVWCTDTTAVQWRLSTDWLALAAEAGHAEARLRYAQGGFLQTHELTSLRHTPRYLQVALEWMEAAARAGSTEAVLALARAYAGSDTGYEGPLGQVVDQDLQRAAMYLHVQQRRTAAVSAAEAGAIDALAAAMNLPLDADTERAGAAAATRWLQQPGTAARSLQPTLEPQPGPAAYATLAAPCVEGRAEVD